MALTKVINDLADLNQSGTTNALKGCAGTTAEQPASSSSIDYLIVGGGGGNGTLSGGAGAGGLLTGTTTVYHGTPTVITVGEGGPAGPGSYPDPLYARNGNDSGFNGIRALGGGSGGSHGVSNNGIDGGSGGGAGSGTAVFGVGSGTSGQGMDGGVNAGNVAPAYGAGGGGGAGNPSGTANGGGGTGTSSLGGTGGSGTDITSFISVANANLAQIGDTSNATQVFVAGGGGGGAQSSSAAGTPFGGPTYPAYANGGGGHGGDASRINAQEGLKNTGGGAGGAGYSGSWGAGAEGGSGVGILKYDNTIVTGYSLNSEDTYTVNWPADKYGVAYWPLNLDAKDVGGNYDGTATDVTYTNGQFNQAAIFNGSSSYIDTTFFWPPISTVSVSIWFNVTTSSPRWTMFGDFDAAGADISGRFSLTIDSSNNFEVNTANGSSSDTWATISASPYFNGAWHHLVMTANGTALKLYLDGILLGSDTSTVSIGTAGAQSLVFGRAGDYNGNYMNGQLEQCRIYTSELSLTDVQDIYNNSKPGSLPPLKTSSDLTTESLSFPSGATTTALWDFNGDSVADPLTYNGTDSNITYVSGKFGECAEFNGTNSSITVSSTLPFSSSFSISMWVNPTVLGSSGTYYLPFMSNGYPSNVGGTGIACYINGTVLDIWIGKVPAGSGTYYQIFNTGTLSTGIWQHLVLTRVYNSEWELYLNGFSLGTYNAQGLTDDFSDTSFYFGGGVSFSVPSYFYNGKIDQTRIFSSALTAQQVYDLWQKENDIQTYITNTTSSTDANDTPANTDILVFKEGSGEITFKNDTPPGAEVGMLRYNSTLGQMEHFNSGGWKDFTNCTTSMCNYPITARCLYTFNGNYNDLCGNTTPDLIQNVYYTPGKFDKLGWNVLGLSSYLGYSKIGWSSGLIADYNATDFSISLWLKLNAYGGASALQYPYIWSGWSNAYWSLHMANTSAANTISFGSWSSADGSQEVHSGVVALDTWYHIVCTRSTTTGIQLYLNNVLISTLGTVYNGGAASVYDMMGGYGDTGYTRQGLDGTISQFRLFEAVLTPTQISQLYNEASCPNN